MGSCPWTWIFLDQWEETQLEKGPKHGVQGRGPCYLGLKAGWITGETLKLTSCHLEIL